MKSEGKEEDPVRKAANGVWKSRKRRKKRRRKKRRQRRQRRIKGEC